MSASLSARPALQILRGTAAAIMAAGAIGLGIQVKSAVEIWLLINDHSPETPVMISDPYRLMLFQLTLGVACAVFAAPVSLWLWRKSNRMDG